MKPFLFVSLVFIDQITKYFFSTNSDLYFNLGWVGLTRYHNSDFAFSLSFPTWLIYLIYLIVFTVIIWYIRTHEVKKWENIGLHFIFAGAVSNIAERILNGSVIDFIILPFGGIWNLADFFIVIGILIILFKKDEQSSKDILSV